MLPGTAGVFCIGGGGGGGANKQAPEKSEAVGDPWRFPFTKNFRKFRWKLPSGEKRVPFNSGPFAASDCDFTRQNFKMWP